MKLDKSATVPSIAYLGEYLRELRHKKKVTSEHVEKVLGIPDTWIDRMETGVNRNLPRPKRLTALAKYYEVPIYDLLQRAGYGNNLEHYYMKTIDIMDNISEKIKELEAGLVQIRYNQNIYEDK